MARALITPSTNITVSFRIVANAVGGAVITPGDFNAGNWLCCMGKH